MRIVMVIYADYGTYPLNSGERLAGVVEVPEVCDHKRVLRNYVASLGLDSDSFAVLSRFRFELAPVLSFESVMNTMTPYSVMGVGEGI